MMEAFTALEPIGAEFGFRTAFEISRFVVFHATLTGPGWQFKDALDAPSWTPLGSAPGTGEVLLLMDAPVAVPIRFYRVRVE